MSEEKLKRGFASMDKEKQRAIAQRGGQRAHELGLAHRFTAAEASAAGRLGGAKVSADRAHMSAIGKLGGRAKWRSKVQA